MKRLGQIIGTATELGMGMGLTAASLVILGLVAGRWIDDRLGSGPLASILLILAGAIAGQLAIYRLATRSAGRTSADGLRRALAKETLSALGFALRILGVMVVPTLLGLGIGLALDARLGTTGLAVLVLALSGFGLGLYGTLRLVRSKRASCAEE